MDRVIPLESLSFSPTASLFEGGEDVDVSIFVTTYAQGQGVGLHLHPYPEVFVVETGTALFTVGAEKLTVAAGNIVTVPAETPHAFEGAGEDQLRVVSVHPKGVIEQTFLG